MAGDIKGEFNAAVRECLANCYRTDLPVAALAQYVDTLRQRDWPPAEIHRLESAVLKILLAVVSQDERSDLIEKLLKPRNSIAPESAHSGSGSANDRQEKMPPNGNVLPATNPLGLGDSAARPT